MSGAEITSANDDASYAKANRKQVLIDTGANIEAATKQGSGQMAFSTNSSSGKRSGQYYGTNLANDNWYALYCHTNYKLDWGNFNPYDSTLANNMEGIFKMNNNSGSIALASLDTTHGRSVTFTTGSSAGNTSGFLINFTHTERDFNPLLRLKFKFGETSNIRAFIGWTGTAAAVGNTDDPLNALNGFGLGKLTTSANFRILHNDSAGVTVSDDTGIAVDTSTHQLDLVGDSVGNRFYWNLDTSTSGFVTSDIPGATAALALQITYINTTGGATRALSLYYGITTSERTS